MKNLAVARRYAKALLLIGKEDGQAQNYREEIAAVGITAGSNMQVKVTALDDYPASVVEAGLDNFTITTLVCSDYICGDVNCDDLVNIGDAVYLLNHIFHEGPAPMVLGSSDCNCDLSINIGDAVYLLNHIFKEGPAPGSNCPK